MRLSMKSTFFKNFSLLIGLLLVPVLLLNFFYVAYWERYIQTQEIEKDTKFLSQTGLTLDTILNDINQAISLLEFDQTLNDAIEGLVEENGVISPSKFIYLNSVWDNTFRTLIAKPYVRSAYFYHEKNNKFIFTTEGIRNLSDFADRSWLDSYIRDSETKNYWAEVRSIPMSDLGSARFEVLSLFRKVPIYSTKGNGVIIVNLENKYFDNLLSTLPDIEEKQVFILDGENQVLYKSKSDVLTKYVSPEDIKNLNELNHMVKQIDGREYLLSYAKSKHYNWKYISIVPTEVLLTQLNVMKDINHYFLLGTLLLFIGLAYVYTRRNFRPIRTMVNIIKHHAAGKNMLDYKPERNDEYSFITFHIIRNLIEKNEMNQRLTEKELLQRETELYALQSQINPHFLYNVLETINWEAINQLGRKNSISELLVHLSGNLRYITRFHHEMVTLEEDLTYLRQYIFMQQMIHQHRFVFKYEIDDALLNCMTIKLLIQPVVENSILHAFSHMQSGAIVKISARCFNAGIRIRVTDNGSGMERVRLEKLRERLQGTNLPKTEGRSSSGIGMQNINHRIKLKFGEKYGVYIHSKLNWGTVVSLYVPLLHPQSGD